MSQQFSPDLPSTPSPGDVLYASAHEVILENAGWRLRHSSYPQLWNITCDFYEGILTLRGVVSSYFFKQLAHAAVVDVAGVNEVANRLEVRYRATLRNYQSP
jgi:osmotically-inducible protein OsmY